MWTRIHLVKRRRHYHSYQRWRPLIRKQRSLFRRRQFRRKSKSRRSKKSTLKAWRNSQRRKWDRLCMSDLPKSPSKSPWIAARNKWSNVMSREELQASCNSHQTLDHRCISSSRNDKTSAWMSAWWMILKKGMTWLTLRTIMRWLICKWSSKLAKQTRSNYSRIKEIEVKRTLPTLSTGFCLSRAIQTTNWLVVGSWAVEVGVDRAIFLRC